MLFFNHYKTFLEIQYKLNSFVVDSRQRYKLYVFIPFISETAKSDSMTKTRNYARVVKHNINRKFNKYIQNNHRRALDIGDKSDTSMYFSKETLN